MVGRRRVARVDAKQWLWLLVPLGSLGIASFVPPAYFGLRQRRRSGYVWSALLLALIAAFFIVDPGEGHRHGTRPGVAVALIMLCWVGGVAVAGAYLVSTHDDDDPVKIARRQRKLREEARALVESDPRLAIEAHIGRPDIAGDHRDGGLVDVNRVPESTLAKLPGIDAALAKRIVSSRREVGGYSSLDDLITTLAIDPMRLDDAADRIVCIPLDLDEA